MDSESTEADSDDSIMRLEAAVGAARAALAARDPVGALAIYRKALIETLRPQHVPVAISAAHLVVVEQAADIALMLGEWPAAESLLVAIEAAARDAGGIEGADYALLKRAHAETLRGDLDAAKATLEALAPRIGRLEDLDLRPDTLPLWEQRIAWQALAPPARALLLTRLYHVFGLMLIDLGQYRPAFTVLERGLSLARDDGRDSAASAAELHLLLARARALLEFGDLATCAQGLAALEPWIDGQADPGLYVGWLAQFARLAHIGGQLGEALQRLDAICGFCVEAGFPAAVLTARLNRAEIWIALNQTFAAETELNAAEHLALNLGDARCARRIGLLREVAVARRVSDEGAVALAPSVRVMQESRRRSPRDGGPTAPAPYVRNPPGQADGFWARFEQRAEEIVALARRGALADLEGRAALMRSAFGTTDSPLLRARLRFLDGVIDESRENREAASAAYQAAAHEFRRMGARLDLWRTERRLARLAAADPLAKGPDWASADATLRAVADTLPSEARAIFLLDKSDAKEEARRAEILTLASRNAEARQTPFWRRLLRSRAVRRDLLALLDRLDAQREGAFGTVAAPMRLRDLPRRSITVVFLSLPHFLFIAALSRHGAVFDIRPVSRLALRDWLAEWHLSARATVGANAGSSLHRLAEAIRLDELVARVGGRRDQLRIVADDVLHGAPFAAFPFEVGQLVERRGLSLAASIRPLRRSVIGNRRATGLLIGVAQGGPGFSPLPSVPEEIARVANWMGRAGRAPVQLRDHQATRDAVAANLAQAYLAHIACHGAFEADRVDASGLVIGPHLDPPQILTIRELQRLDLSGLSHVTLSACWAADNYILPGRQVLSLPGCLVQAGVGTVLACLWLVSDESALPFIARFYALAERRRRVDALRLAQLEALEGRIPGAEGLDLSSPYLWAGFTLYGEDCRRPLALPGLGLWSWLRGMVPDGFRCPKPPSRRGSSA